MIGILLQLLFSYFFIFFCASFILPVNALVLLAVLAFSRFEFKKAALIFLLQCFLFSNLYADPMTYLVFCYLSFTGIAFLLLRPGREPQAFISLVLVMFFVLFSSMSHFLSYKLNGYENLSVSVFDLGFKVFVNLLSFTFLNYLMTQVDRLIVSPILPYLFKSHSINLRKIKSVYSDKKPFGLS